MAEKPKVAIGSDHAAVSVKAEVVAMLTAELGYDVVDVGTDSAEKKVDYPDVAIGVCKLVQAKEVTCGILFCGTGIGVSLAANKMNGIRAALCHDHFTATMARQHNDANVLCAGARVVGPEVIKQMVQVFLATPFEGGRHEARVGKVMALEA